ncbi:hypothetical protein SAMN05444398_1011055 [Roseovarius pacificus]|uniref:Uncharacterized protein n=1 Tax=Roseovarius pacificus TaxID=337701 RepID=A0A1M6YW08_9RHOB|nr:hypothetical protein [Roseovarius pacificus]GGO50315.1 hypothetical protein GCM10011315_00790 [Roseovarius pacificus]SHL22285.1 hypothetical protein SAMN05444398_1011055 [Roseovarius pacificus]
MTVINMPNKEDQVIILAHRLADMSLEEPGPRQRMQMLEVIEELAAHLVQESRLVNAALEGGA